MAYLRRAWPILTAAMIAACAGSRGELRDFDVLYRSGRWFRAREKAAETLKAKDGAELKRRVEILDRAVRRQESHHQFDPVKYFYAQAYLDYFERQRYGRAAEAMQEVLTYALENDEMMEFLEKAQDRADAQAAKTKQLTARWLEEAQGLYEAQSHHKALDVLGRVLGVDPSNQQAQGMADRIRAAIAKNKLAKPIAAAAAAPPAPPPPREWLEARYRQALQAYLRGESAEAVKILRENLEFDAGNDVWLKTLKRIEAETPAATP